MTPDKPLQPELAEAHRKAAMMRFMLATNHATDQCARLLGDAPFLLRSTAFVTMMVDSATRERFVPLLSARRMAVPAE